MGLILRSKDRGQGNGGAQKKCVNAATFSVTTKQRNSTACSTWTMHPSKDFLLHCKPLIITSCIPIVVAFLASLSLFTFLVVHVMWGSE